MMRNFTIEEVVYSNIEVDIPENATADEIETLVRKNYEAGFASWHDTALEAIYDSDTGQEICKLVI